MNDFQSPLESSSPAMAVHCLRCLQFAHLVTTCLDGIRTLSDHVHKVWATSPDKMGDDGCISRTEQTSSNGKVIKTCATRVFPVGGFVMTRTVFGWIACNPYQFSLWCADSWAGTAVVEGQVRTSDESSHGTWCQRSDQGMKAAPGARDFRGM